MLVEHPSHPRLHSVFAQIVDIPNRRLEQAEERLRMVLDRDPFLVAAYRQLGQVYELTERLELAVETYREGLKRQPDDAELHAKVGVLLAQDPSASGAERHLQEAIRLLEKPRPDLHVTLGSLMAEKGKVEDARIHFEIALAHDPGHAAARNNRAIAFYRLGRVAKALVELDAVIEQYPNYADALNNRAAIEVDRGSWEAAENFSRRAVEVDPTLPEAWNNLGAALDELHRAKEARPAFARSLELNPDYWRAKFNLAVLERRIDEYQEAERLFLEVVDQVPNYPESHLELGRLYAGPLGKPELARVHLNAFLNGSPRHPQAASVRQELIRLKNE